MSQALDLLHRAIKHVGNGRALARLMGKPEQRISNWKNGIERIPDDSLAELASIVGEDPIKVLADERGGAWKRVAHALRDKASAGFDWLLSHASPRRSLIPTG